MEWSLRVDWIDSCTSARKAFVHGLVHGLIEFTWTKFIHAISPEIQCMFSKNFKTYDIISFANLRYSSSHLASEDVTRDRRVSSRQRIHLQEVERANGMVLGWGKCWTFDLSQPRFQHLVRHDFRLPANVSALRLSPVGVTSQYTTERTTDKQFTALTALNTVLLSLRECKKTTENDTILQWSTFSLTELSRMCVITCSRHGNGIGKSAIWQVSLAVRKREIYHRNRYPIVFHLSPTWKIDALPL